jgi:hypothetical protein
MVYEPKDITEVVMTRTDLVRDIEAVRQKCLTLPMVSSCDAELVSFKGRPLADGRYEVDITGSLRIRTNMKLALSLDATGTGEIDGSGQNLTITDVKILNDFQGLFTRVLGMTGLAAGRTLSLRVKDSALIRQALAA